MKIVRDSAFRMGWGGFIPPARNSEWKRSGEWFCASLWWHHEATLARRSQTSGGMFNYIEFLNDSLYFYCSVHVFCILVFYVFCVCLQFPLSLPLFNAGRTTSITLWTLVFKRSLRTGLPQMCCSMWDLNTPIHTHTFWLFSLFNSHSFIDDSKKWAFIGRYRYGGRYIVHP